jgi:predicted nucleic acid-binding Zn finger protein
MVNSQVFQNNIPVHQNMALSLKNEHESYNGNSCDSSQTSILKYVGNEKLFSVNMCLCSCSAVIYWYQL